MIKRLLSALDAWVMCAGRAFGTIAGSIGLSRFIGSVPSTRRPRGVLPVNSHMKYRERPTWTFLRAAEVRRHDGLPYMRRLLLLKTPWFRLFLHKFLADDDICLHDHPFSFLSVILWGRYREYRRVACWLTDNDNGADWLETRGPLSAAWRPRPSPHRVELIDGKPCYTFVVTGPGARPWGFYTPQGWIHWKQYDHERDCA